MGCKNGLSIEDACWVPLVQDWKMYRMAQKVFQAVFDSKTIVKIPSTGGSDLIEKGQNLIHSLYPVLEACGISEKDIIHFSRTIRSAMHGFIPAGNEPSGRACTDSWRMPQGSNTPPLGVLQA